MAAERHVVPPTPTQLLSMKTRLAAAHRGYSLLKRKADALALRFRQVVSELRESKGQLGSVMKDAFFSLAAARCVTDGSLMMGGRPQVHGAGSALLPEA